MFQFDAARNVYLHREAVDFRKSINGLAALAEHALALDPFGGALYVFRFKIMPWIMMFVMAPFAAGLLLYWTVSNILTIAQQKWLYSRHPALKTPVATT